MSLLPDPASSIEVTPREVQALLDACAAGEVGLIDCREEDEWSFNRLPHAHWIPLSAFTAPARPEIPWVIYCHHGMRSLRAAHWLREKGIEAWSMSGGIDAWSRDIDPSVPVY